MKFRYAAFTRSVLGFGKSAEALPCESVRRRPVPQRDAETREMFAKLHRNPEFSVESVSQAFAKALARKVG